MERYIDRFSVILLDVGRTFMFGVDRFGGDDGIAGSYLKAGGRKISAEDAETILRDVFKKMCDDSLNSSLKGRLGTVASYIKKHPLSAGLPTDEILLLERVFAEHEIGHIPQEYVDILAELEKTHRLGIVSDIWSDSRYFFDRFYQLGIDALFERMVFSSDIGIVKPHREIFEKAIGAFNADRKEIVYVGDSLRRDVGGAQNAGLSAIWINSGEQSVDADIKPDFIIRDLKEILHG